MLMKTALIKTLTRNCMSSTVVASMQEKIGPELVLRKTEGMDGGLVFTIH